MEYTVTVVESGTVKDSEVRYTQSQAEYLAVKLSRMFTSTKVTVTVTTDVAKRGFPKQYRMGRLHRSV